MQTMNDSFISEVAVISWKPTPPQPLISVKQTYGWILDRILFLSRDFVSVHLWRNKTWFASGPTHEKYNRKSFCFIFSSRLEKNYCTIRRHYANGLYENASGHFTRTLLFHKINQYCFLALKDVISGKHQMAK